LAGFTRKTITIRLWFVKRRDCDFARYPLLRLRRRQRRGGQIRDELTSNEAEMD
jgi:hypothetical protein